MEFHLFWLALEFLKWLFPTPPLQPVTDHHPTELRRQFRRRDWLGLMLGVDIFAGLFIAYDLLLDGVSGWLYGGFSDVLFLEHASANELRLYALLLAIFSWPLTMTTLVRFSLGRDESAVYQTYWCNTSVLPCDYPKLARWTAVLFLTPLVGYVALRVDEYSAFTDQGVIASRFGALGDRQEYSFADVRGVYEVRGALDRNKRLMSPCHVIVFSDGWQWKSAEMRDAAAQQRQQLAVKTLAAKAQRPLQVVNSFGAVPR